MNKYLQTGVLAASLITAFGGAVAASEQEQAAPPDLMRADPSITEKQREKICSNIEKYADEWLEKQKAVYALIRGLPIAKQKEALMEMNEENVAFNMAVAPSIMMNQCDPAKSVLKTFAFGNEVLIYSNTLK